MEVDIKSADIMICTDITKGFPLLRKPLKNKKVGATGFEPATSRPPAARATKLRHTPVKIIIAKCVCFCNNYLQYYILNLKSLFFHF